LSTNIGGHTCDERFVGVVAIASVDEEEPDRFNHDDCDVNAADGVTGGDTSGVTLFITSHSK
jgi:hypothetical protein